MAKIKSLKIAQIAPLTERVPPKKYGGIERGVFELTEGLLQQGHHVTLFASGDSQTSAKLIAASPSSLRELSGVSLQEMIDYSVLNSGRAFAMQDTFDIIHDHSGVFTLPLAHLASKPVVMTFHGPFTKTNRRLFELFTKAYLVAISHSQASKLPHRVFATIYNGLTMDTYPFSNTPQRYLLFVGRISPEKGVHYAIEVARRVHMPLVIAAKLDPVDKEYFETLIKPKLSSEVSWVGEVAEEERNTLMSNALAFLHPVTWEEPFGLTLIEAMACGCLEES